MGRASRDQRRMRFEVECLEDRAVPTTFGVPWSDPRNLTLSFVPDGAPIAAHTSTLFQTLNAQQPTVAWQQTILRAFQTWAVNANINIGLVSDGGQALGVAGQPQHDTRFGDIRIGAQPMDAGTLSISVPNDPLVSSTFTGDVLLNSDVNFNNGSNHLFTALLHEAGHVFGIGDSSDPSSVMYMQDTGNSQLNAGDIAGLQALYGSRAPDPHEGSGGNDLIGTATTIQEPGGSGKYTGATPLIEYGEITTNQDIDFYAFKAPDDYTGPVTIQLRSAGISLLNPHLTLLDASGTVLGDAQSTSNFGDVVTLHLDHVDRNANYYLEVQGATADVFGIGSYGVAVTFDSNSTVSATDIESVLRGPYQSLSPNDINAIFLGTSNPLFNNNVVNNTPGTATQLVSSPGYARNSHYEAIGSLSGPADTHYFRIPTADNPPGGQTLVLTVTARALDVNGTSPRVTILDGNGHILSQQILANGAGMFTVQASGLSGGGSYVVETGPNTAIGSPAAGNYALTAEFGTAAAQLTSLTAGTLASTGSDQSYNLYVGESQLMHLVLSASAVGGIAAPGSGVQMNLMDASGNVVYSLTTAAGDTVSGAALFLTPGPYLIQVTAIGPVGSSNPSLAYNLLGDEISDPIGTVLTDPTLKPIYPAPMGPPWFLYPGSILSTASFLITPDTGGVGVTVPSLVSISVTSSSSTIVMGAATQFIATGTFSDNSRLDLTNQVSWSSSVPGVAVVSSTGVATGVTPGHSAVLASFQGVTGSSILTVSEPATTVSQPPPTASEPAPVTVSSVKLVFGKRHTISQIRVTFSGAVNTVEVQAPGIYRLATPGKKGSFTARNAGIIRLKSAVYDTSHNVVVLTPKKAFALTKHVQLLINGSPPGGLHDSLGRLIDGDQNGLVGGNAVALIQPRAVTVNGRTVG